MWIFGRMHWKREQALNRGSPYSPPTFRQVHAEVVTKVITTPKRSKQAKESLATSFNLVAFSWKTSAKVQAHRRSNRPSSELLSGSRSERGVLLHEVPQPAMITQLAAVHVMGLQDFVRSQPKPFVTLDHLHSLFPFVVTFPYLLTR